LCRTPVWHDHVNAIHRAGRQTQIAAGAFIFDDSVHLLGSADNCIDRAGLDTQGAANTGSLIDHRHRARRLDAIVRVQWCGFATEQVRQGANPGFTARRALVDVRFTGGDGFRIWPTSGVIALTALCLRQKCLDLVGNRIALYPETNGCPAQQQAKSQAKNGE